MKWGLNDKKRLKCWQQHLLLGDGSGFQFHERILFA